MQNLLAQVALETVAFVESPSGVHFIFATEPSRAGTGQFTYVNTNNGDFDIVKAVIGSNRSFQGSSALTQRTLSGQIGDSSVVMNFAGAGRTATREPTYGPTGHLAGRYFGSFEDEYRNVGALNGILSSTGKFLMYAFLTSTMDGTVMAVGTVKANGDFFVKFTSGVTGSGNFAPENGRAFGAVYDSTGYANRYFLAKSVAARLANIATRGRVTNDSSTLIGGLIVSEGQKGVLIVARGPSLAAAGVSNPVPNPKVQLYLGDQLIASNNNWRENSNASEIAASGVAPSDDREAALQLTLEPNSYTVVVSSESSSAGTGIVEVYGVGGPLGR